MVCILILTCLPILEACGSCGETSLMNLMTAEGVPKTVNCASGTYFDTGKTLKGGEKKKKKKFSRFGKFLHFSYCHK